MGHFRRRLYKVISKGAGGNDDGTLSNIPEEQ